MTRQFGLVRWLVPIQCLRLGSARLRPLGRAIHRGAIRNPTPVSYPEFY